MTRLITYMRPNHKAVEESHVDKWRVFNGENWVHGFEAKEHAIEFAREMGGTRIAFCKRIDGNIVYVSPERVEQGELV